VLDSEIYDVLNDASEDTIVSDIEIHIYIGLTEQNYTIIFVLRDIAGHSSSFAIEFCEFSVFLTS
jgi:hypothetical protein